MTPEKQGLPTNQLDQIADRLKNANNVLVTVSSNPTVDQLAACIGLTLVLNKMDKHGTAVFSGRTPSTIEFLKPEKTLEKDTNSLRDFIISLDKSKADKLRYKVENDIVKIFITPYRTSITEKDFDFSQGDFNVDVVMALGVNKKTDLDKAITSHGRILHDATVVSVNTSPSGEGLGSMDWISPDASSLCEMVADLASELDSSVFDNQISTALLTGIVVETDRFSNEKSSPHTMQVAGKLMESGASTQLITTKLEQKPPSQPKISDSNGEGDNGILEIEHKDADKGTDKKDTEIPPVMPVDEQPKPAEKPAEEEVGPPSSRIKDVKSDPGHSSDEESGKVIDGPGFVSEPPQMGGRWTANDMPEYQQYSATTDPLSQPDNSSIMSDRNPKDVADKQNASDEDIRSKTLHDIEESVKSPHLGQDDKPADAGPVTDAPASPLATPDDATGTSTPAGDAVPPPPVDDARDAVEQAVGDDYNADIPDPIQALNAQEFDTGNDNGNGDNGLDRPEGSEGGNDKPPGSSPPPPVPPPMTP
jgi:hypothetical protein